MSIIVRSNEKPAVTPPATTTAETAKPVVETTAGEGESKEASTLSAPEGETHSEQNQSSESETEETREAKEGQTTGDEPGKKKGGFQRRIDKLNSRVTAKEQEVEFWKQQALKNASVTQTSPGVNPTAKTAQVEGKPKPESFDTHTEYVEALTDWKTETKLKERDDKQFKERIDQEQSKIVGTYTERAKAFSEKTADFSDVLAEVDHIPLSPVLRDIILNTENGPQLAYELAKNPEEYARIAKLPAIAVAREVGKLEYRLQSSSKASSELADKKITKAPKPLETVGTGGKGSTGKSITDPSLTQREYEALRREQIKKRRQA